MLNPKCDRERQDKIKNTIISEALGVSIHCVGKFDTQKDNHGQKGGAET